MNSIEEIEYKGYTIKIYQDDDSENPRQWDPFGHMVCFHRRYTLGDESDLSMEELNELIKSKDIIALPLYLYDHSGITMSTGPFSCPWDSGQVGYIYVTHDEIKKEYNVKRISKSVRQKAINLLESEVKTYDQWLTGEVYGYVIEDSLTGNMLNSCWGFFGYPYNYMIDECKSIIDGAGISKTTLFEQTMGFAVV
jgi:hypothetical protein